MIKVIAFDLVGVLVGEKDIVLNSKEEKLERMFGDNISDEDYMLEARKLIEADDTIIKTIEDLIEKLYVVKEVDLLRKIKEKYPNIKIIIATNHVSHIRKFIYDNMEYLDDLLISAEIHKIKPNDDFYYHILDKYNIKPNELLFLDDKIKNANAASNLGIKTIKVDRDMDIYKEIINVFEGRN